MPTSIHGPFKVSKRRVNTRIPVLAGDRIRTLSTGLLDLGGAVLGFGQVILDADGDSAPVPPGYPAPSLRKNSLICGVGTTWHQGGVNATFDAAESGALVLFVNDGNPQDNSREWTVVVYHTPAAEPAPVGGKWTLATVDGVGGAWGAHVGASIAALRNGSDEQVFYADFGGHIWEAIDGRLRHLTLEKPNNITIENLDGSGGPGGRTSHVVALRRNTALKMSGTVHVFYHDEIAGTLRHASRQGTGAWMFEVVDGAGGANGQISGIVGRASAPVVRPAQSGAELHVFYWLTSIPGAAPPMENKLQHARLTTSGWEVETLDGIGGADGRTEAPVGRNEMAIADSDGSLYVFYSQSALNADGDVVGTNLRLAKLPAGAVAWQFETLDGAGGGNGRISAIVGDWPTAALYRNELHVFYFDSTNQNVRHAVLDAARTNWRFEGLDGLGDGPNGRTSALVGVGQMSAVAWQDQLSLCYYDWDHGNLRHAWTKGGNWQFQTLDGDGGQDGRINEDVGSNVSAFVSADSKLVVYYSDDSNDDLRRAEFG